MTPEIIAHRGASADAPENTLAAIQLAWQQGADAAEIDVQRTSDGQLVAIHDETTLRTGGGDEPRVRQFLFKTRRGSVYRGLFAFDADEIVILRVRGAGQPPLESDELR